MPTQLAASVMINSKMSSSRVRARGVVLLLLLLLLLLLVVLLLVVVLLVVLVVLLVVGVLVFSIA